MRLPLRMAVHPCPDCGAELWLRFDLGKGETRSYDLERDTLHVCPTPRKRERVPGRCSSCGATVFQTMDGRLVNDDDSPHAHVRVPGATRPVPVVDGGDRSVLGAYEQ